jgi:hypothetical protein
MNGIRNNTFSVVALIIIVKLIKLVFVEYLFHNIQFILHLPSGLILITYYKTVCTFLKSFCQRQDTC